MDHLASTQGHKPNHTIPNQDILGPFIGLLDPFLGQKYQKPIIKDFKEYSPLKYIYVGHVFHWSRFWTNSLDLEMLLTTCEPLFLLLSFPSDDEGKKVNDFLRFFFLGLTLKPFQVPGSEECSQNNLSASILRAFLASSNI